MKTAIAIAAAGLLSLGIAGQAQAKSFRLTPPSTSFTGSGQTSATKSGITLKCKANLAGNIDANGVGSVTSGSFSGQLGCSSVTLGGLPWTATATSAKKGKIAAVTFNSPIGACGPGDLPIKIVKGNITFTNVPLAGGCTITGKIKTTPAVGIEKVK